jgi:hypothetical protein
MPYSLKLIRLMLPVAVDSEVFDGLHGGILFGAFNGKVAARSGNLLIDRNLDNVLLVVA